MTSATGSRRLSREVVHSFLALFCLVQASIALADTPPTMNLTFDEDYWMMVPTSDPTNGDPRPVLGYLSGASSKFSEIVIDTGTPYRTWLHSEISPPLPTVTCTCSSSCQSACATKRTALGFQITPSETSQTHIKDKVQLSIEDRANPALTHIPFGNDVETQTYVGFDVMLDPTYTPADPSEFVIHFQLVQGGGHPIFTMQGEKSVEFPGGVDLVFYIANDATEDAFRCSVPPAATYHQEFHRIKNVTRGTWLPLVVQFIPPYVTSMTGAACGRSDGCGQVAVYRDHLTTLDKKYNGLWGFDTTRAPACAAETKPVLTYAAAGLGIYRSPQQATQTIYFDNVKIGPKFSTVNAQ
jgi:hypothetical protein